MYKNKILLCIMFFVAILLGKNLTVNAQITNIEVSMPIETFDGTTITKTTTNGSTITKTTTTTTNTTVTSTGATNNTLNTVEQKAYNTIKQSIITNAGNRLTSFSVSTTLPYSSFSKVLQKIFIDYKLFDAYDYYNSSNFGVSASFKGNTATLTFRSTYRTTKAQEDYVNKQVASILKTIIKPNMTTVEKELAIHNYIINNVQYDTSSKYHDAYSALAFKKTVCQGYSLLAYKMFNKAGIPSMIVEGGINGSTTKNHTWNLCKIDGQWYHVDLTWDDPISKKPVLIYDYFNLTDTELFKNKHMWFKEDYPTVSTKHFNLSKIKK